MMSNTQRFVYIYFNRHAAEKFRHVVPAHVQYWKNANLMNYSGGPFGDRTGGLISFSATSMEEATRIIQQDPFLLEDLVEQRWIKEWIPE